MLKYYDAWEKAGTYYSGLAELVVNAMVDVAGFDVDHGPLR